MKTNRRQRRVGNLLFFIPIIIIGSLIIYAFIELNTPGKLEVTAIGHDGYVSGSGQGTPIQVQVTVQDDTGGQVGSGTTPTSLSLRSGTYTVTYGTEEWYTAPADKTVAVPSGMTVYAVGVYQVVPTVVSVTSSGFNSTKVSALHEVTPVIWINTSTSLVLLKVQSVGTIPLEAGQNYTQVFQSPGAITFSDSSGVTGSVQVV